MVLGAGRRDLPYEFELKCHESLSIWAAIEQSFKRHDPGNAAKAVPCIVAGKNRTAPVAVLPLGDWLNLATRSRSRFPAMLDAAGLRAQALGSMRGPTAAMIIDVFGRPPVDPPGSGPAGEPEPKQQQTAAAAEAELLRLVAAVLADPAGDGHQLQPEVADEDGGTIIDDGSQDGARGNSDDNGVVVTLAADNLALVPPWRLSAWHRPRLNIWRIFPTILPPPPPTPAQLRRAAKKKEREKAGDAAGLVDSGGAAPEAALAAHRHIPVLIIGKEDEHLFAAFPLDTFIDMALWRAEDARRGADDPPNPVAPPAAVGGALPAALRGAAGATERKETLEAERKEAIDECDWKRVAKVLAEIELIEAIETT